MAKKTVKKTAKKTAPKKKTVKKSAKKKAVKKAAPSVEPKRRPGRPSSALSESEKYLKAGSNDLDRKNAQSAAARELSGKLPPVADPARRAAASESLEIFCTTYLPKIFKRPFSAMQRKIAEAIEDAIVNGGKQAIAVYRRGRKTSTSRAGLLWALLCKNVRYAIFLGATDKATQRTFEFYRDQIFCNDLLLADFPEVFFPLRETKGSANKSLLFNGEKFRWKISSEEILFPMLPGFLLSGRKLDFRSIKSGSIRGSDHTIFGETVRPSLILADDVKPRRNRRL